MAVAGVTQRSAGIWVFSILACGFGLLTIKSGGAVLFFDGEARQAAGNYVPFVLWFNFLAGFLYVITGIVLWSMHPRISRWSAWLSVLLAGSTLFIFAAFGLHIINGGAYEIRTVMAMTLRSGIWIVIAAFTWYRFMHKH